MSILYHIILNLSIIFFLEVNMEKEYYLGLDIGTNSVGWAVSDTDYNIPKFRGNAMWGIRLFDECKTAEERRMYRGARRRGQRKRERIALLEMLFSEEISKVDPAFYQRLHESNLYMEDKSENVPYAVFADENYTDKDFHKEYPTIYHVRKELIESKEPHDIRLVYLALHHIFKSRGHFLFEFDYDSLESINDLDSILDELINYINDNYCFEDDSKKLFLTEDGKKEFAEIIKDKSTGKTAKNSKISTLFGISKNNDKQLYNMLALLSGSTVKLADVFDDDSLKEAEAKSISFANSYDDNVPKYQSCLNERFELIEKLKAVYDWAVLADVLNGKNYLSEAKVEVYEKHNKDLKRLKSYVKTYLPEKYKDIFSKSEKGTNNYVAYSSHIKISKGNGTLNQTTNQEDFCKYLKKVLGNCVDEKYQDMFSEIELSSFMPKQVSKNNGVIPMQVNEKELVKILDNAREYLPFLNSVDDDNISIYDKIIRIFEYRIPFYVGPLNNSSEKYWLRRKEGKIYPWNIDKIVDFDKSAEAFIDNLTNKCTYLPQYDVVPKNSLLYCKFSVLNELNNLKINGEKISVELKQNIYNDCFMTHRKVTKKFLENTLKSYNIEYDTLSGFDIDFKSSLATYMDLKDYNLSYNEKEEIVKAITVFGENKKLLRKRLRNEFASKLTEDEINKISHLKYSGWGRLSKEFLTQITATYKQSGEVMNIITAMWETNLNLMELLYSSDFCCDNEGKTAFVDKIAEYNTFDANQSLNDIVNDMYVSPKIKRPIYQSLLIAKEIEKIMKAPAKKIFIEVARTTEKPERTISRKDKLVDLYKSFKNEYGDLYKSLLDKNEDELRSDKLYLYYTQFGKCMYTGEAIDLNLLMGNNSTYDIDHIYPRSKIKDDSLKNRVLVNKTKNSKKDNEYPISQEIRDKMTPFWKMLLSKGLIDKNKFYRLTRNTPLTDSELTEFVSRQLVETSQSAKAVANTLKQLYQETEIVYVKAGLVSEFRQEYDMLKCREVNDFHHAKDAYLNIVVGNVYNVKFTHNKANFVKELQMNNKNYTVRLTSILNHDIKGAWDIDNDKSFNIIKNTMNKNNIRYTRYAYKQQGGFWDQQPCKKCKGQIPLKQNSKISDIEKYGGYNKVASAYFSLVKYKDKKGKDVTQLVPVNIYNEKEYLADKEKFVSNIVGFPAEVIIDCVKYNSCLSFDGFRMHISSKSENRIVYKPAMQLVLGYDNEKYIKGIVKCLSNDFKEDTIKQYKICNETNIEIYDLIVDKTTNSVLKIKFEVLNNILVSGRDKFINLNIKEQCEIIMQILSILHCNVNTGNLILIGGSGQSGTIKLNSIISKIGNVSSIKLINQSVTGLYENEIKLN